VIFVLMSQHSDFFGVYPRMILLMMLVVCLNGTFTVEQPFSSFFEYYPKWRDFLLLLQNQGVPHAVTCLIFTQWLVPPHFPSSPATNQCWRSFPRQWYTSFRNTWIYNIHYKQQSSSCWFYNKPVHRISHPIPLIWIPLIGVVSGLKGFSWPEKT